MKQRATLCRVEPVARVKCADMDMSARVAPVAEPQNLMEMSGTILVLARRTA